MAPVTDEFPTLDVERVAQAFHWHYERLAVRHGYATRPESAVPWDEVPAANRALMVDTVRQVLRELQGRGFLRARLSARPGIPVHQEGRTSPCPCHACATSRERET